MKRLGAVIVLSAVSLTGLAFVHPFGNPRVEPAKGLDTLFQGARMSSDTKRVLVTKCADCHSNETRWPVYARLAPGSWLIERDIVEARRKMNLSLWDQMPADAQSVLAGQIIHEAKSGDMPPLQYRLLHWNSELTATDIAALSMMETGAQQEASVGGSGDAARGKSVFDKRCTGCHAMEGDREGPRLAGVFGRKAGSVAGFDYSAGLKNSGITWDETTLEKWLSDPDTLVPDNKMDFHVPAAQERSDLIAYFKHQKGQN
ncbi:heme-binding domain-containing protein [Terriglobus saanensis]|uniref:Cytochrome c class I n=1 Tax=Terriglobus saanensis (strain ATCC BAA-1853 / DSM 23119 / SP1PR4) TaxID=401053 RepID=E8V262_TERSS|nr:heme-binding domain-containing protein [Terriglobus saanensis]ADV84619.1 cytochrome c class I [Terriglobus saanensis SP1PR4]